MLIDGSRSSSKSSGVDAGLVSDNMRWVWWLELALTRLTSARMMQASMQYSTVTPALKVILETPVIWSKGLSHVGDKIPQRCPPVADILCSQ